MPQEFHRVNQRIVKNKDIHLDEPIATGRTAEIFPWKEGQVLKLFRELICIGNPAGISPPARMAFNTMRRWYHSIYMRRYFELSSEREQDLESWLLPISAGRLSEDILDERDRLLEYVRRLAI